MLTRELRRERRRMKRRLRELEWLRWNSRMVATSWARESAAIRQALSQKITLAETGWKPDAPLRVHPAGTMFRPPPPTPR